MYVSFTWIESKCDFTFRQLRETQIREWQLSLLLFVTLSKTSERLGNFCVISRKIVKSLNLREIGREGDFITQNWSETWFREMLRIALGVFVTSWKVNFRRKKNCTSFWSENSNVVEISPKRIWLLKKRAPFCLEFMAQKLRLLKGKCNFWWFWRLTNYSTTY